MRRPLLEVADLVRTAGAAFIEQSRQWIRWKHVKVLLAIARCRTAALGGHVDECTRCGHPFAASYWVRDTSPPKNHPLPSLSATLMRDTFASCIKSRPYAHDLDL